MSRCYVYVIGLRYYESPCKIGISSKPGVRLAEFQTANPWHLTLYRTYPFDARADALAVERAFHSRMRNEAKMFGEWVNHSVQEALCLLWATTRKKFGDDVYRDCGMAADDVHHVTWADDFREAVQ